MGRQVVGDVPAESLVLGGGAPQFTKESIPSQLIIRNLRKFDINSIEQPEQL